MSQNVWATIMPFGPVTLIFYWPQKFFSGHPKADPHFRHCLNVVSSIRVSEIRQTRPTKFAQILLLRTDIRLVFYSRKLMSTDIFFNRTIKIICNLVNHAVKWNVIMFKM